MNKIKILINLINGSLKAQIIAGVVATSVVATIAVGGVVIYNNYQNKNSIISNIEKSEESKKQYEESKTEFSENAMKEGKIVELTDEILAKDPNINLEELEGKTTEEKIAILDKVKETVVVKNEAYVPAAPSTSPSPDKPTQVAPDPVIQVTPDPVTPDPVIQVTPDPVTPDPVVPTPVVPIPVAPTFTGFSYNLGTEGQDGNYVGGDNDYASIYPFVSNLSTITSLIPDVNKAVCALTQGANEGIVKSKFIGKTYRGMTITGVTVERFNSVLRNEGGKVNQVIALTNMGATNMPSGGFASVIGKYQFVSDNLDVRYFKVTVTLK